MRLGAAVTTRVGGLVGALLATAAVGGCSRVRPDPVTEQGDRFASLWPLFVSLGVAVVALIWALTIWSVVRYRRRSDAVPGQRQENRRLEVLYTVVPVLTVALLFGLSVSAEEEITAVSSDPDVRVEVIGFQWQWQFRYPDEDIVVSGTPDQAATLVLPVGRTAQLRLVSEDVNHSFWVPRFLSKRDLIPGVRNEIDVTPTETGTWAGRCAEYCGLDHWRMYFEVQVVDPEEYDRWVQAAAGADPTDVPLPGEESGS